MVVYDFMILHSAVAACFEFEGCARLRFGVVQNKSVIVNGFMSPHRLVVLFKFCIHASMWITV